MKPNEGNDEIKLKLTFFDDASKSNCTTKTLEKSTIGGSMDWIDEDLGDCKYLYILNPIKYRTNVQLTGITGKFVNQS